MSHFVDSFFYIALLNPRDAYHGRARQWAETQPAHLGHGWTTHAVLLEVANALSSPTFRRIAAEAIRKLYQSLELTIVPITSDLFERALALYEQRPDKEWSLTDCISFIVMQDNNISDALTADHHFEQAGFRVLLREVVLD